MFSLPNLFGSGREGGEQVGESDRDENVVAGAPGEVNDEVESTRALVEALTAGSPERHTARPAVQSTPRTSPVTADEGARNTDDSVGYVQPDDPLNLFSDAAEDIINVDSSVVRVESSRSSTNVGSQTEETAVPDCNVTDRPKPRVRFDTPGPGVTRRVTPPASLAVRSPYFLRSSTSTEAGADVDAQRYQSFINDFSIGSNAGYSKPVAHCTVKPKKFDGRNWAGYRLHFLSCSQANGWDAHQSALVLKACLNEESALALRRSLRRSEATLEEIFQCLDERYMVPGPEYVLRGKIRRTVQQPGQSVSAFQVELMGLLSNRVEAEDSAMALEQFIYGLSDPHMQKYVAKRNPIDLHDALTLAKAYEETSTWLQGSTRKSSKRVGAVTVSAPAAPVASGATETVEKTENDGECDVATLKQELEEVKGKLKYWRNKCFNRGGRGRGRGQGPSQSNAQGAEAQPGDAQPADQRASQPAAAANAAPQAAASKNG